MADDNDTVEVREYYERGPLRVRCHECDAPLFPVISGKHLSYVAITDEMAEAACKSYHEDFAQYANREAMKHALEAALACAPQAKCGGGLEECTGCDACAPSRDVADCSGPFTSDLDCAVHNRHKQSAPAARRPSRDEVEALRKSSPNGFDEPEEETRVYGWNDALDDVLALFDEAKT